VVISEIEFPAMVKALFSTWVICPSFSARVIFERQSPGELHPATRVTNRCVGRALAAGAGRTRYRSSRSVRRERIDGTKRLVRQVLSESCQQGLGICIPVSFP
jgi:hypothetical protein